MKDTALLAQLLGIEELVVESFAEQPGALFVNVRPAWKAARCSRCGASSGRIRAGRRVARRFRHLDIVATQVILQYSVRRVRCPNCSEVLEAVPWSDDVASDYTKQFEEEAARVTGSLHRHCDLLNTIGSAFPNSP